MLYGIYSSPNPTLTHTNHCIATDGNIVSLMEILCCFLVFAFELCPQSSSQALLHVLTVKLEENFYVCLAKHSIQYKILTEPVGGFYTSPVLAT